ncbi:unnamed protein product [Mesocestoides corti]|uniref:Uncharacterized protein n=1 Tax=Mesocestoides corti TaxID=53468 RepID=A0A158QUW7_MESCO|nr:unnamed protein product [Mesocestoides corti]
MIALSSLFCLLPSLQSLPAPFPAPRRRRRRGAERSDVAIVAVPLHCHINRCQTQPAAGCYFFVFLMDYGALLGAFKRWSIFHTNLQRGAQQVTSSCGILLARSQHLLGQIGDTVGGMERRLTDGEQHAPSVSAMVWREVYIRLKDLLDPGGIFHSAVYLERGPTASPCKDLAWTSCAVKVTLQKPAPLDCLVIGTRAGEIAVYTITSGSTPMKINPAWSLKQCHGRGGVTALQVLHNDVDSPPVVFTAGRLQGRIRRWRLVVTGGSGVSLQALDQVLKPSGLSWIGSFAGLPSGEVLALGFVSTEFHAVEFVPAGTDFMTSDRGDVRFSVDCAGGNRAWDFAYDPHRDAFVFAAIQKDKLVYAIRNATEPREKCAATKKFLIPPLHGRDINACIVLPQVDRRTQGSLTITCLTGSEECHLGSFSMDVKQVKGVNDKDEFSVTYHSSPRFHAGHISNIRCLAFCQPLDAPQPPPRYLVSGGGRGMLAIWRLQECEPGLIGWVCLDSGGGEEGTLVSCSRARRKKGMNGVCDLRIMTLLGFQRLEHLLVVAGCSDGSIRY